MTKTTVYTLTGSEGSLLTVFVVSNEHNIAIDTGMYMHAVSDDAPDYYADVLGSESEFIVGRCFDGQITDGEQWATAMVDGQLYHADMITPDDVADFAETFTAAVAAVHN